MQAILLDETEIQSLIARRRETGADRYDEVWEGVYVMSPLATNEHQRVATAIAHAFRECAPAEAIVLAGANVSERAAQWEHDYRCPDVVVVLPGSRARDLGTHWQGGPDLVVEMVSPNDRSRDKLDLYGRIGVREACLVERDTKAVEIFRLEGRTLVPAGSASPQAPRALGLETLPLTIGWRAAPPHLVLTCTASGRTFAI